jgi:signal peptidase II
VSIPGRLVEGHRKLFWGMAVLMFLVDQLTKVAFYRHPEVGRPDIILIPHVLKLVSHAGNERGILGLGPNNPAVWVVLAALALGVVAVFFLTTDARNAAANAALGMVAGGAIGNLLDRIRFGYVRDFIDLHWGEAFHWHTFNWADTVLCAGIAIIVWDTFLGPGSKRPDAGGDEGPGENGARGKGGGRA